MSLLSHASAPLFTTLPPRRTILLVEDEPFVRDATSGILENAGFKVLPVADAPEAIELFEHLNHAVDILMTDMVLPHGDGHQLGNILRKRSPDLAVLITSGYSNMESELEQPANRFYFLAKPYSRHTLVEKIEGILSPEKFAPCTKQAG